MFNGKRRTYLMGIVLFVSIFFTTDDVLAEGILEIVEYEFYAWASCS